MISSVKYQFWVVRTNLRTVKCIQLHQLAIVTKTLSFKKTFKRRLGEMLLGYWANYQSLLCLNMISLDRESLNDLTFTNPKQSTKVFMIHTDTHNLKVFKIKWATWSYKGVVWAYRTSLMILKCNCFVMFNITNAFTSLRPSNKYNFIEFNMSTWIM